MELEANYRKKVVITNDCGRYFGWVDELTYNRYTNECSITLIGAQQALSELSSVVEVGADVDGIEPGTIIMVIQVIKTLIDLWRKRK